MKNLLDGHDLSEWRGVSGTGNEVSHEWLVSGGVSVGSEHAERFDILAGQGVLVNGEDGDTANFATLEEFGDCDLHIEFVVPKGSNSGVYLMGRYEIQILDSWGADTLRFNTCGGVYARWINETAVGGAPPRKNASRPPGTWQEYDIRFRAPRFGDDGRRTENARFDRVVWNGEVVHENVEVEGPTRGAMAEDEAAQGPLMLQGDHGPVAYRDIRITSL
jgi:hypothetical protein